MEDSLSHSYIEYYTSCIYIDTCRVLCFLYMDIIMKVVLLCCLYGLACFFLPSFSISHKHVLVIIDKIIKYLFN